MSIFTALSVTILTIVFGSAGVFGIGPAGSGSSPPKDEGTLKKLLNRVVDALKRLAGKAFEALLAIVASVVGAILGFLGKDVGLVT